MPLLISIIVPIFNEAAGLECFLQRLCAMTGNWEWILVDGGSCDESVAIARQFPVSVITSCQGRGIQLQAGAEQAHGDVLLFLHADTYLPDHAYELIVQPFSDTGVVGGDFILTFERYGVTAWPFYAFGRLRRRLGMYYGDSAMFIRRNIFEALGGFCPFALFEDYDLCRRMELTGKTVCIPVPVVTSSRRYEGNVLYALWIWFVLQSAFWLGVHPTFIAWLYRPIRRKKP